MDVTWICLSIIWFILADDTLVYLFIFRTYWISTFFLVLFLSTTNIMSIIDVWINNPTIIVIENSESSIYDIPFPSLGICSTNQLRKSVWERYMNTNTSYWWVSQWFWKINFTFLLKSFFFFNYWWKMSHNNSDITRIIIIICIWILLNWSNFITHKYI